MAKGETAKLKREAERLMSRIVLANGLCVYLLRCDDGVGLRYCGATATDCAHVLAKSSWPSVRYYVRNGLPLCRPHHIEARSARLVGPSKMRALYMALRGRMAWNELITAASKPMPPIAEIVTELRSIAAEKGVAA